MKSLDLGCGPNPQNPFGAEELFGVDIAFASKKNNVIIADLVLEKIPFPDNYFDFVTAIDFIEHIPRLIYVKKKRSQPFINLMNEIWRVLKPDGVFLAYTPAYPMDEAFVDPTHINFISFNTVNYFCGNEYLELSQSYGFIGLYEKIRVEWSDKAKYHLIWELKAKKTIG